ncbi:hypothetical protein H2O64_20645 [Kordia sp. YSTF-M3]|uniref:Uncharacterized protein n=1 Tax=Kordia aestuariivivens TaxID=2759037 RepID=A0ABR7QET7_9FLAO|nr:hypothetical protein [Kordia aestuariivivens]MBC8757094.1 hypothetical protein [Kordia aestuariivivens]
MKIKTKIIQFTFICTLLCSISIFQSCSSVETLKPLPSDESPILRAFPSYFDGDFELITKEPAGDDFKLGRDFIKFTVTDQHKLTIVSYLSFTKEELAKKSKYYTIKGELLVYKNDSLHALKEKLENKKSTSNNLTEQESSQLLQLKEQDEKGQIFKTFPLSIDNKNYSYQKQLIYEIDLKTNLILEYDENTAPKKSKCVFKKYKDHYFLNMFNKDKERWVAVIFQEKDTNIIVSDVDFDNLNKNSNFYKSIANLIEKEKYTIVIDPSKSQFESLMQDANFLGEIATLQRTKTSFSSINNLWLSIGAIVVILIVFIVLKRFRIF